MLTQRQTHAAIDLFAELSEADSTESFISVVTAGLHAALDIDVVAYCEWHPGIRQAGWTVIAPDDITPTAAQAHMWDQHHREDLWIRHAVETGDHAAVKLTDIASRSDLSKSPTYQGTYRRAGFDFIAHVPLSLDAGTSAAVAIGRTDRDLDDDVMYLFGKLARPMRSARRRLLHAGHDISGAEVPDVADHIENIWTVRSRSRSTQASGTAPPERLTARQAEVLHLVTKGMTNNQIGRHLDISHRTVQKHLEVIFQRLQVRSRTAAATSWLEAQDG